MVGYGELLLLEVTKSSNAWASFKTQQQTIKSQTETARTDFTTLTSKFGDLVQEPEVSILEEYATTGLPGTFTPLADFDSTADDQQKATLGVESMLEEYKRQLTRIESDTESVAAFSETIAKMDSLISLAMEDEIDTMLTTEVNCFFFSTKKIIFDK